jgi:hypothetical protein
MRLKKFCAIFSFLLVSGCVKPEKPVTEVCQLDAPALEGICGVSGGGANTQITRKPLLDLDKSTMFPPKEWKKYKSYVDELSAYADYLEKHCK